MPWVGYLAAALGGVLLGWLVAAMIIRRVTDRPVVDPQDDRRHLAVAVLEHSDSGYLVTDRDGNVLLANQRAGDLRVIRAGLPDERISNAIARTAVSGEPVDVDLGPLPDDADAARDVPSIVHAVAHPLGADTVLVIADDETASRRVEAIRRDFVANVSHELKTPVGAIALLAEAVLDGADDPESVRHFSAKMLRESTRLGALVNELIALSRLQGGLPLEDLAVVEVDGVVSEAVGRLSMAAETANIDVVTDRPSGLLVRGDRTLLVTALTNLIDNAISYSPAHTIVSVTRGVRPATGSMPASIDIAVTDRGIGIAPEHQGRVFERFFRIDPARSRATGGTGLGLAIVKHVAANHGGQALLWSRQGTGSTFTLRLPQVSSPTPAPAPPVPDKDHVTAR